MKNMQGWSAKFASLGRNPAIPWADRNGDAPRRFTCYLLWTLRQSHRNVSIDDTARFYNAVIETIKDCPFNTALRAIGYYYGRRYTLTVTSQNAPHQALRRFRLVVYTVHPLYFSCIASTIFMFRSSWDLQVIPSAHT